MATMDPMCTMGPSRPRGAPAAMARQFPNTFTTNVLKEKKPLPEDPLRKTLDSGMPDAAACGLKNIVMQTAIRK